MLGFSGFKSTSCDSAQRPTCLIVAAHLFESVLAKLNNSIVNVVRKMRIENVMTFCRVRNEGLKWQSSGIVQFFRTSVVRDIPVFDPLGLSLSRCDLDLA